MMGTSPQGPDPLKTSAARRRAADIGASPLRTLTRRYGLLGAALGLGSPLGLLAGRFCFSQSRLVREWLEIELKQNGEYYIYAGFGTVIAMALGGLWAGRRVEAQRGRADLLERAAGRLRDLAVTDGLTGVYVRRHFLEKLEEELRRAERYRYPIASLFIDVDNFKAFNEDHGHVFGDEVLRRIAEVVKRGVRETDVVGRYGGDEFLVLLPHAGGREAMAASERIRKGVEDLTLQNKVKGGVRVTVSVGVITAIPHRADVLHFLEIADQALHRSKGLGKNCTILCDVPSEPSETDNPKES